MINGTRDVEAGARLQRHLRLLVRRLTVRNADSEVSATALALES